MAKTEQNLKDHDLLIRLDENVRTVILEIKLFRDSLMSYDTRLRIVEDSIVKMSPIPTVSHKQVVDDLAKLSSIVAELHQKNDQLFGGWRTILIIASSLLGVATFAWTVLSIFNSRLLPL